MVDCCFCITYYFSSEIIQKHRSRKFLASLETSSNVSVLLYTLKKL